MSLVAAVAAADLPDNVRTSRSAPDARSKRTTYTVTAMGTNDPTGKTQKKMVKMSY